ncbi:hypothetical protein BaRGS_00034546 [Batillaria attramentaria]|uniref:Uncharacterized protein n=1 Tax=Batillaria attramentaria TaxID=370345 RepID=A0ABD0JIG7_9CAEN
MILAFAVWSFVVSILLVSGEETVPSFEKAHDLEHTSADDTLRRFEETTLDLYKHCLSSKPSKLSTLTAKLQTAENSMAAMRTDFNAALDSIRNEYSAKFSTLQAAQAYKDTGSGANRLCLSKEPVFGNKDVLHDANGHLYGAEYWTQGHERTDVLCSVCHTSYSTTFMIPGTNSCPSGTHLQYAGYLAVGDSSQASASEFVCLDSQPEDRPGTSAYEDSAQLDQAITVCGTLPCPPYVENKVATCAVCSI